MAAVVFAAKVLSPCSFKRMARDRRDPVVALLAVYLDVRVADLCERLAREFVVGAFRFLQAQDVGSVPLEKAFDQRQPQPHGIDVPRGDDEAHGFFGKRQTRGRYCSMRSKLILKSFGSGFLLGSRSETATVVS